MPISKNEEGQIAIDLTKWNDRQRKIKDLFLAGESNRPHLDNEQKKFIADNFNRFTAEELCSGSPKIFPPELNMPKVSLRVILSKAEEVYPSSLWTKERELSKEDRAYIINGLFTVNFEKYLTHLSRKPSSVNWLLYNTYVSNPRLGLSIKAIKEQRKQESGDKENESVMIDVTPKDPKIVYIRELFENYQDKKRPWSEEETEALLKDIIGTNKTFDNLVKEHRRNPSAILVQLQKTNPKRYARGDKHNWKIAEKNWLLSAFKTVPMREYLNELNKISYQGIGAQLRILVGYNAGYMTKKRIGLPIEERQEKYRLIAEEKRKEEEILEKRKQEMLSMATASASINPVVNAPIDQSFEKAFGNLGSLGTLEFDVEEFLKWCLRRGIIVYLQEKSNGV